MNLTLYQNENPLPAFPKALSTELLGKVIGEAQNNLQAPYEMVALSALTVISASVCGAFDVLKPNGQRVPTAIMTLIIANSGERKTSSYSVFVLPLEEFQEMQMAEFHRKFAKYKAEHAIWKAARKTILKSVAASSDEQESELSRMSRNSLLAELMEHDANEPQKPRAFKLIYENTTSEALYSGLHENIPVAALFSDEAGIILNGRATRDMESLNKLHSGSGLTIDRKNTPSLTIPNARLVGLFLAQESAVEQFQENHDGKARNSGLCARLLVSKPQSTQGTRFEVSGTQSWEYRDQFSARIHELLKLYLPLLDNPDHPKKLLQFSPEAADLWLKAYNNIERDINPGGRLARSGDMASKLADNMARVAAVLHAFEYPSLDLISKDTLRSAIDICTSCAGDFLKVFDKPPIEFTDAQELNAWFDSNYKNRGARFVYQTEVRQYCLNKLRSKNRLDRALMTLQSMGYIRLFKWGKSKAIDLNPLLYFDQFMIEMTLGKPSGR